MINNHKYDEAIWAASPNFTNQTIIPKLIVMHYTATWGAKSVLDTFSNPARKVSAQFTIDLDGTVYQHVLCNKRAWHAGPSTFGKYTNLNSHSIGIEFVNIGFLKKVGDGVFEAHTEERKSAEEIGEMVEQAHARVGSGTFYWPVYPEAQLVSGERLVRALVEAYDIEAMVTHEEIDNRGWKVDPGPAFDMSRFEALLHKHAEDVLEYEVTADGLNVRRGPGTSHAVITKLERGTKVQVFERSRSWARVGSGSEWVHGDFLRLAA